MSSYPLLLHVHILGALAGADSNKRRRANDTDETCAPVAHSAISIPHTQTAKGPPFFHRHLARTEPEFVWLQYIVYLSMSVHVQCLLFYSPLVSLEDKSSTLKASKGRQQERSDRNRTPAG